ncbi:mitoferrin-1 isoform X3 [Pogoniulus pusillus]|uniref:mitoferrin-1 isoform X3 n=1 Tax=Pogoniulus pusillus TaxID=488313 RepID=UPI0030B98A80
MELSCGVGGSAAAPPGPGPPPPAAATPGQPMESEEYESLPSGASLGTHMMAGAVAGIMEHTVMYPVDSVKTRMQSLQPDPKAQYRSVYEALKKIVLTEGVAGSVATLLHDAVMNPAEVVKQRLQMFNSPYTSVVACVRTVQRTEGFGAFYRSYTTQLTMNVPFQAIHFITYEFMQEQLNPHRDYHPQSHIVSGAVAGAVAAAATTPLDVCKTLLNTQENLALSSVNVSGHLSGMLNAFKTVYQLGGLPGYFRGVQARVIYQMPSTAIAWSVYELFKYLLTKHKVERRASL